MSSEKITTRMAPSPTGALHVGSLRTALYNFLFARQNQGDFVLRIEDTDKERSKKEFEKGILDAFSWLKLDYDNLYRQSDRLEIHKKYLEKMIEDGYAYRAEPSKGETGNVIRFKNPNKNITFNDLILGEITVNTSDLGDFVLARDIESPLYHFVVVVDDFDMNITHVIRAQEHLANTPRQILIQEAIGAPRPTYAHIPIVLAPDKSKLSKRHGATAVMDFKEQGYLPQALINFLALIGWNPGTDKEIFSLEELIQNFDLTKVQKGGGVFNQQKLDWINRQWLDKLTDKEFEEYIKESTQPLWSQSQEVFGQLLPLIRERINNLVELRTMIDTGEFDFFFTEPEIDLEKIIWKKGTREDAQKHLLKILELLETTSTNKEEKNLWTSENIKKTLWDYAEKEGKGDVLWPLRYALSGREKSPDPFTIASILGKEETLTRINSAQQKLS